MALEDRVLDGPASGQKGSKGATLLFIKEPGACSSAANAVNTSVKLAHSRCRGRGNQQTVHPPGPTIQACEIETTNICTLESWKNVRLVFSTRA